MTSLVSFTDAGVQGVRLTRKRQMIKGVPRIAGTHEKEAYWLFEHLSVDLPAGEVLALVAKDPDRVSAALRVWAGLLPLDAGEAQMPASSILIVSPPPRWVRELSVEQTIRMLAGTYGLFDDQIEQIVPAVAKTAQVANIMHQPIEDQSRRVRSQIAFAIGVHAPVDVVMFDQMAAVGSSAFRAVCPQLISGLKDQGKAVAFTAAKPQTVLDTATRGLIVRAKRADEVDAAGAAEFLLRVRAKSHKQERKSLFDEDDDSGPDF